MSDCDRKYEARYVIPFSTLLQTSLLEIPSSSFLLHKPTCASTDISVISDQMIHQLFY